MPNLIHELQSDAMGDDCPLGTLLRKALVVAKKLCISDFELWVDHELNGYPPGAEVPKYREVVGRIEAYNPYNGWIPVFFDDKENEKIISRQPIRESVSSLENLTSDKKNAYLEVPFSPEFEERLMKGMGYPHRPACRIGSSQVVAILQSVRNTVLSWTLDLEKEGILGGDMTFTKEERQAAKEMQTVNIVNFQGVLGDVQNSTVTQNLNMDVRKGDFDSLAAYLRSAKVEYVQIADLKDRIKEDSPPVGENQMGPKVSSWIGDMVAKAASGAWPVALEKASSLLSHAICRYYGFT